MTPIGRVHYLPFRQAFLYGSRSTTAWIEQNITVLSERIRLPLLIEAREVYIGDFAIDLICTDVQGNRVLVKTQHNEKEQAQLPRLMQYLKAVSANTAIWITPEPLREHVEAMTYLNAMTSGENQFYLLKVEAIRIEDSPPAPFFHVLTHPENPALLLESPKNNQIGASTTVPVKPMRHKGSPLVWCVSPRRDRETHALFMDEAVIGLGISRLGDLRRIEPSLLGFKQAYKQIDPFHADYVAGDIYGALYHFVHDVNIGDYVVYAPTWLEDQIYIGKITGDYAFTPAQANGYPDCRPVRWLARFVPGGTFTVDALEALRQKKAFFRVHGSAFIDQLNALLR